MSEGKELKPIPEDNEGLPKLPEDVRNKMGFMQAGETVPINPLSIRPGINAPINPLSIRPGINAPINPKSIPAIPANEQSLINKVIAIILGQSRDNGEIDMFVEKYGSEMFQMLRQRLLQSVDVNPQTQGLIQGQPNGGMSDEIFGTIAPNQPVAVSPGEYIIPADVVSDLGDGDTNSGARKLDNFLNNVREEKTGSLKQAEPIKLDDVMKGVM
jgi:hypothetical protein